MNPFEIKHARKIIEVTMFWNEDTIVRERIQNTLEYADVLIVAEGNESHSGLIKRSEYQFPKLAGMRNEGETTQSKVLESHGGRVIFVPVDLSGAVGKSPGEREKLVRDAAMAEVVKREILFPQDVLLVQDFDEFLHPAQQGAVLDYFSAWKFWRRALRLRYRMTYYKLNLLEKGDWDLALAIRGSVALRDGFSPNFWRHDIRKKAIPLSHDFLGWHHSYLGDVRKVMEKIKSFSHALDDMVVKVSEAEMMARLERGEDLYGRGVQYEKVDYRALSAIPALQERQDLLA